MKDYMESALEMARQLHESLGDINEWEIDNGPEMLHMLQDLQIACMVGPYGVTSPPPESSIFGNTPPAWQQVPSADMR